MIVPGYCNSKSAIMQIAHAGRSSSTEAGNIMKKLIADKACQFRGYPDAMLRVEDVIHVYRDAKGRVTQVLRARPVNAPMFEVYAIVLASRAPTWPAATFCPGWWAAPLPPR